MHDLLTIHPSTHLVADGDTITLVHVTPTATGLHLERFPLGTAPTSDDVLRLFDHLGLTDGDAVRELTWSVRSLEASDRYHRQQYAPTPTPTPGDVALIDDDPELREIKRIDVAFDLVSVELDRAMAKHPSIHSLHEGYAVILEEVEEFWQECKRTHTSSRLHNDARNELIQIAAMAIRTIVDVPPCEVADDDDD